MLSKAWVFMMLLLYQKKTKKDRKRQKKKDETYDIFFAFFFGVILLAAGRARHETRYSKNLGKCLCFLSFVRVGFLVILVLCGVVVFQRRALRSKNR